jgi:hypothetical protein
MTLSVDHALLSFTKKNMGDKATLISPDVVGYHSASTRLGLHGVKRVPKLNDNQTLRWAESRLPHRLWATCLAVLGGVSLRCLCAGPLLYYTDDFTTTSPWARLLEPATREVTRVLGQKWAPLSVNLFSAYPRSNKYSQWSRGVLILDRPLS